MPLFFSPATDRPSSLSETRFFSTNFVVDTAASFLDRRVKSNQDAIAIIEDLHEHHLLDKLTQVIPKLSTNVLLAFSKALAFQDLLITSSSTDAPPIFGTQGDAFSSLLSALPRAKTRQLFLATTPERVAQALSAVCKTEDEAFDLAISLELGGEHEDAVIDILASTSFQDNAANLPPDATNRNVINAGPPSPNITAGPLPSTFPEKPVPASAQSSGTTKNGETSHQPSASTSDSTHASRPVAAAASSTLTAETAAPPQPSVLNPTPSPDSENPAATAHSAGHTGPNVCFPPLQAASSSY